MLVGKAVRLKTGSGKFLKRGQVVVIFLYNYGLDSVGSDLLEE